MNYKNYLKEQLLSEIAYNKGNAKVPSYLRKLTKGITPVSPIKNKNPLNLVKMKPNSLDIIRPIDGSGRIPFNPDKTYSVDPQRIGLSKTPRPRYLEKKHNS